MTSRVHTTLSNASGAGLPLAVPAMATLCLLAGAMQFIGNHLSWILWLTVSVLSFVGFWGLLRLLLVPDFVTAWSVYGVSLALSYGFGAFNTLSSGYAEGTGLLYMTYSSWAGIGKAEGIVAVLVATLLWVGHVDPYKLLPREPLAERDRWVAFVLLVLVFGGLLVAFATGQLGFQGVEATEEGSPLVSPLAAMVRANSTPALALAVLAFANRPRSTIRWVVIALCLGIVASQVTIGRRVFLFNMLTAFIALMLALDLRKLFTRRMLVVLLAALSLGYAASRFFPAMRVASFTLPEDAPLIDRLQGGWDVLLNPQTSGLDEHIDQNQSTRTFIVGYLAELIEAYERSGRTTGGDILVLNLAYATPTVIWPEKWYIINRVGSDEMACHAVMGLPSWDAGNTLLTSGLCDGGWTGLLLMPLGLVLFMSLLNLLFWRAPTVVRLVMAFATIGILLHTEATLTTYLSNIRNVVALVLGTWVLVWLINWFEQLPVVQHVRRRRAAEHQARLTRRRQGLRTDS